jgi:tetratricopeptide (TPR) repeat protein
LVAATQGNPLALLEVADRLDDAQWLGAAQLPDPLPAGDRLREHFGSTLSVLSPAARTVALYLALVGEAGSAAPPVVAALAEVGIDIGEALEEGRRRGVLVEQRAGYRIRHPLLRSSVLELATPGEQREAHAALAAALPPNDWNRVWHLAESNLGRDAQLADLLVAAAGSNRGRLGFAAAATALERASALTPDPDMARQRLALAARDAFQAGDVGRVRDLVGRVLADGVVDRSRGEALFTLGMLEQYAGSVPRSVEYLDEASTLLEGSALVRDLTELALARFRLNEVVTLLEARIAADGGVGASGEPLGVAPLLVEAYLGLGKTGQARSLATRYADATSRGSPKLSVALAWRCVALTAREEETAQAAFATAQKAHAEGETRSRRPAPGCCTGGGCDVPDTGPPPGRS